MEVRIEDHECAHVRTARIVGFRVPDNTVSPTSVLSARQNEAADQLQHVDSSLAAALRRETFKPLPRLSINTSKPRGLAALKKSKSHADLQHRAVGVAVVPLGDCSEPVTPGSRSSTASTPVRIPAT